MATSSIIQIYDIDEIIASSKIIKNYDKNDIKEKYDEVQKRQTLENRILLTHELFKICLTENGKEYLLQDKKFRDNMEKEVYSAIWYIKNVKYIDIQLEFKLATYELSYIINNIYIQERSWFWRTFCTYPISSCGCCVC
jgi:hypothetical protein